MKFCFLPWFLIAQGLYVPVTALAQSSYEPYYFTKFAGSTGVAGSADGTANGGAQFRNPLGVAVDNAAGNVYVADRGNNTIRKITPDGVVSTLAGLAGNDGSAARFFVPTGVTVDSAGNVYVADERNHTIRKITPDGVVNTLAGLAGSSGSGNGTGGAARFNFPEGVAVDSAGNVYVADTFNQMIREITPAGVVSTLAGSGATGSADGQGINARFQYPRGVAVSSAGNVYVADERNNTIRKITSDGVVSTLAGLADLVGSADGTGSAARFHSPTNVAVDSAENVYVSDSVNQTIRKITSAGVVTTLAGSPGNVGNTDGIGSVVRFNNPYGVAVDSAGNVYVGDNFNQTIRLGIAPGQAVSAVSHKMHGTVSGDINLPQIGPPGVECRTGTVTGVHQILVNFASNVTVSSASITSGTGNADNFSVSGGQVTVNLSGVTNAQVISLKLTGVNDGVNMGDVIVRMGVLSGDTTGDGHVNASDITQTKMQSGQGVSAVNFRHDVNSNGAINASDVSLVKSRSGTALP